MSESIKPIKKSASDLEAYRSLLQKKYNNIINLSKDTIFNLSEYSSKFEYCANVERGDDIFKKICLIDYELDMALLSTSIEVSGEKLSVRQACDHLLVLNNSRDFYNSVLDSLIGIDLLKKPSVIGLSDVYDIISSLDDQIYSLESKILKSKNRIMIEIDPDSLIFE